MVAGWDDQYAGVIPSLLQDEHSQQQEEKRCQGHSILNLPGLDHLVDPPEERENRENK